GAFFLIHFGSIVLRWLEEQASKEAIKGVFGSFVSENVMNQLLKSPENVKLGGESKPVTIFFSDIRSFSTFSENMGVQDLINQLNEYFVRMVNRVIVNDGTLHKFIGDAVMAVWGDVLPSDLHVDAKRAVRAACEMREELIELNKLRRDRGLFDFHIGMGLNHGTVVVGNIGAEGQKLEFTVIGDAVNLASRLEGVTKQFHTDLVIGESVYDLLDGEFRCRSIGLLVVKGKTKPIRAYEVFEEKAAPNGRTNAAWVDLYEKGFDLYLERKFAEAIACFEECLKTSADDFCTLQYLESSRELLVNPPDEKWNGVLKLDSK
ncbi:MAG TPA: adenylate/guanylate cyclase domain-containing protein, partial [Candidatus Methylacidiphilales bacterium]